MTDINLSMKSAYDERYIFNCESSFSIFLCDPSKRPPACNVGIKRIPEARAKDSISDKLSV